MRIDVYFHFPPSIDLTLAERIDALGVTMSLALDALSAQVQANNDLAASAIALIQGLAKQISDNVNDPVALAALADSLKASDADLAAAIAANTPAAPVVP